MKQSEKWMRGLPYVGNKGQKAQQIIDTLPAGGRFIDVFGGGGSISLTAANSGKWDEVIYNDRRKTVVELLHALITDEPHIDLTKYVYVTREQFFDWRDNQPDSIERTLVLTAWSFSNNLKDYLWSRGPTEDNKLLATRAMFYGDTGTRYDDVFTVTRDKQTIADKYMAYHKWRREAMNVIDSHANELERLQQLEQLERLKYSVLDYRDLVIRPDDIVYLDPPYSGTEVQYDGFDGDEFQKWLSQCPAKNIFISEYTQLPHTEVAFNLGKRRNNMISGGIRLDELLLRYVGVDHAKG